MFHVTCIVFLSFFVELSLTLKDVYEERDELIKRELSVMLGHDIVLSDSELQANLIIMNLKNQELDYGFHHPQFFNLSKHFFDYKEEVKKSKLYEIIKKMPKGAVLHAHDTGLLGPDYVLSLTYLPNLYVCLSESNPVYRFSNSEPTLPCETLWQLLSDVRRNSENVTEFDSVLKSYFTLVVENPKEQYPDINAVWSKFASYFASTWGLFSYRPVWETYFYDALKTFREDNVMYVEVRSVLPELYDLNGNVYDSVATAQSYKSALDKFLNDYPDFMGAKLIYAPLRSVDPKTVEQYLKTAWKIKGILPDFLAGFDLVGQEDLGRPTKDFFSILKKAEGNFDYFFHAGETNWCGMSSDENLVDAIVLNARRIGHAYALAKHPVLLEEVRRRDIAIEANVISNVVLKLVDDVRNHPLAAFLARDLPVVVSSDDPGLWEADPLTHDLYVTFVAVANRHADLRLLKKLALNSLKYSSYEDKMRLVNEFDTRWEIFINSVIISDNNLVMSGEL